MRRLTYVSAGVLEWREAPRPRIGEDRDALCRRRATFEEAAAAMPDPDQ